MMHFLTALLVALVTVSLGAPSPEHKINSGSSFKFLYAASRDLKNFNYKRKRNSDPSEYSYRLSSLSGRYASFTPPSVASRVRFPWKKEKQVSRSFQLPTIVRQSGLTGEICSSSDECADSRTCESGILDDNSRCIPSGGLEECGSSTSCEVGEVCLTNSATGDSFCLSQEFADEVGASNPDDDSPPPTDDSIDGSLLTGDRCSSSSECAGTRTCVSGVLDDNLRCIPESGLQDCNGSSDCEIGEVCLTNRNTEESDCFSQGFADEVGASNPDDDPSPPPEGGVSETEPEPVTQPPSTTPTSAGTSPETADTEGTDGEQPVEDPPCIAVHSLKHLSRDELVFQTDILANVLCDQNDSCATPGHMVTYQGKGMMMKSYCEIAGCIGKVMHVNSPRYRRGITVPSRSNDMSFTAFSARYATRAEEGMLSVAIRVGL